MPSLTPTPDTEDLPLDLLDESVNLFEVLGVGKPHVRFCEGPGPTDVWLKYGGTAGKPGGKQRKQTSTCSIGRNWSTRLIKLAHAA